MTTPEWNEMQAKMADDRRVTAPSKPPLKSLAEHNAEKHAIHRAATEARRNGIACPDCGEELWDSNPMVTLTTDPPQKDVRCIACLYRGYRLA